jgi:hypothetical protein
MERGYLEDLGIDGKTISELILGIEKIWLEIETSGGLL